MDTPSRALGWSLPNGPQGRGGPPRSAKRLVADAVRTTRRLLDNGQASQGRIASIGDDAWTSIEYTDAVVDEATGRWISPAEAAEIEFTAFAAQKKTDHVPGRPVVPANPGLPGWRRQSLSGSPGHVSNASRSATTFSSSPVVLLRLEDAEVSDGDDSHQFLQPCKVLRVAGHQRQILRNSRGRNQQVREPASRLSARRHDRCMDTPVGARSITAEGNRLEGGLCALQTILAASALSCIRARSRPSSQLSHRDGGDPDGIW